MNTSSESGAPPAKQLELPQEPANTSSVPLLGEGFQEASARGRSESAEDSDVENDNAEPSSDDVKPGKRRLFGFGKRREEKSKGKKKADEQTASKTEATNETTVQPRSTPIQAVTPIRSNHPYQAPTSPNRTLYSSSPRIASPAGSQIFERDVQESALPGPNSPAIPSHVRTENHIPPVLDASSEAITNTHLDPDSVEIVMHSSHQPAAVTVTGVGGTSEAAGGMWADDLLAHPDKDDAASNYGALDSTDVRRLSFISFADVVQSEHAEHSGSRDSIHVAGLRSLSPLNRSPSPIRSPVSSQGHENSPPTSKSASMKGIDLSPSRVGRPIGSPTSTSSPTSAGELTIETMSQALRKTGSGDLSGARNQPLSPVSLDGVSDASIR